MSWSLAGSGHASDWRWSIGPRASPVSPISCCPSPAPTDREPGKFADLAVPELIDRVVRAGASRRRLEAVLVGGARMFALGELDIGARNAEAVRAGLAASGLSVRAAETGGNRGRTMRVDVGDCTITVKEAGGESTTLLDGSAGAARGHSSGAPRRREARRFRHRARAMSEMLDRDKVAALVEAAKQGQLPEQAPAAAHRRGQRLRTVDFSRPTKFTSDHQRRISRAIDTFCQTSVTGCRPSSAPRSSSRRSTAPQATWSGAQSQLPTGSLFVTLDVQPLGTRMLFTVEQSFVLMCLDLLLGGSADKPPRERRFSEIDNVLTQRLFESLVHQLSLVWQDLAGISLSIVEIESHNDTSQIAAVSEPTFVVVIESRINKHSASMALLIPWLAIDEVGGAPVAARRLASRRPNRPELPRSGARSPPFPSRSAPRSPRSSFRSTQILSLGPGSVIRLGAQADQGVTVFAENVKLARAQPGCNGARRAIQVSGTERKFG